ncbi:serine/threonine protein kinase [Streptomyces sp. NPDC058953]|uniref:serine/threonine protein kinase n=1 Tax=unclassified Streptomyces TaxID=2593676 RepID=UPI003693E5E5
MAERSTAAVDVADNGGDEPPTAQADKATTDGAAASEATAELPVAPDDRNAQDGGTPGEEPAAAAPELHSGHKLAQRYRLEECITRLDGFSSWRAVDEKLRRAVGVHVLPADHPRARSVLAAARSAALLGDARFVMVLDAVEENDLVYVVHEWLPDATELTTLLAMGPLEPHEAYRLVDQLSQAMAAAHREGLSHLKLTPSAILRTSTGQYRVRGLAVNAALRGITAERPQRTDTEAIGALLYAALTQRWPYENDAHGLSGLPKGVGLLPPDQVRAGVHRGLSELSMRALVNDGATASRQEPPCTTPEELAKAVAEMPRIRPPEPAFAAPPEYQRTTYQQGSYGRSGAGRPGAAMPTRPVPIPPPPMESRAGKALKWTAAALLIAALGLGSWQISEKLLDRTKDTRPTPEAPAGGGDEKPAPPADPLTVEHVSEFTPNGSGIQRQQVPNTVDGDPGTSWITPEYRNYPNFGNLPQRSLGSGIVVDLGSVRNVSGLDIDLYRSGNTVEVLAAGESAVDPASLSDFGRQLAPKQVTGDQLKSTFEPVRTRYVLIRLTSLPPADLANRYRGGISEIRILGK